MEIEHSDRRLCELETMVNHLSLKIVDLEKDASLRSLSSSSFDSGDTAWVLASTALVLFMTIPGLALYYGGTARTKNVLAIVIQCFTITALITILWFLFGYSLAFAPTSSTSDSYSVFGDTSRFWLSGLSLDTYHELAPTIPEAVFCSFMLMFAIITPALITGAFAERMKFHSMLVFMSLWHLLVYCPIAHSMWHPAGFLYKYGALDYAGGNVVHVSSGVSGLVCVVYLGARKGFGKEAFEPHNILLTVVGSAMLWVGWFGFNAGSAVAANDRAAMAMLVTQIATATAVLSWMITEWVIRKQPSVQGIVSGAVAGLVAITPASGYVDQTGAFFIGLLAGPLCYFGAQLKHQLGYDDALDAFGVHAVGGIVGGIGTGFFASSAVSGSANGVFYTDTFHGGRQLGIQIYAIVFTVFWSLFFTSLIVVVVDLLLGLRVTESEEEAGLDASIHGHSESISTKKVANSTGPEKKYELNVLHEGFLNTSNHSQKTMNSPRTESDSLGSV